MKIKFFSLDNRLNSLTLLVGLFLAPSVHGIQEHYKNEPSRLITLGGTATEIVFALGAGEYVIATDQSSTYPPAVTQLPQVGYIRSIPAEGVLSLRPNLVIATDTLGPPASRRQLERAGIPLEILHEPQNREETEAAIERIGNLLNRQEQARKLIDELSDKLTRLAEKNASRDMQPKVLFFLRPPGNGKGGTVAGSGNRADAMIRMAGGRNAMASQPNYVSFSVESIIAANPDVILLASMEGHGQADPQFLLQHPALSDVSAVKKGQVLVVSLDDLNFGPRLAEIATRWANAFYP